MKRQSPLAAAILYFALGSVFVYLAIEQVNRSGWTFFSYLIVFLATMDIGAGIRLLNLHFRVKRMKKK